MTTLKDLAEKFWQADLALEEAATRANQTSHSSTGDEDLKEYDRCYDRHRNAWMIWNIAKTQGLNAAMLWKLSNDE